jgi:hypothetical protein
LIFLTAADQSVVVVKWTVDIAALVKFLMNVWQFVPDTACAAVLNGEL